MSRSFHIDGIQQNALGQTATLRCEGFPMFQGMTPSPSSACCWWLGRAFHNQQWTAQAMCKDLLNPPTNQRGRVPSCAQAEWRYTRHRVGHLVISSASTKPLEASWNGDGVSPWNIRKSFHLNRAVCLRTLMNFYHCTVHLDNVEVPFYQQMHLLLII